MAQIAVEMTGDESQLVRSLGRTIREQEKMINSLRGVGQESRRAGRSNQDAFGGSAVKELKEYAAGLVSIGSVLGAISATLAKVIKQGEELAGGLKGQAGGLKRLAQVSASPQEFEQLDRLSKIMAVSPGWGGGTVADAMELVFQAKSQGLLSDIGMLGKASGFVDPKVMAESIGKFKAAYGAEAGSGTDLMNKFIAAAATSNVSIEQIASAAVISAQGAMRIGATDEEHLALLSVLSPAFKSPETASERLGALSSVLAKGFARSTGKRVRDPATGKMVPQTEQISFAGGGFMEGLARFRSEHPKEFTEAMLGRDEAAAAVQAIDTNAAAVAARRAEIEAAQRSGAPLKTALGIVNDPNNPLHTVKELQRQKNALEITGESAGLASMQYDIEDTQLREGLLRLNAPYSAVAQSTMFQVLRGVIGTRAATGYLRMFHTGGERHPGGALPFGTSADTVAELLKSGFNPASDNVKAPAVDTGAIQLLLREQTTAIREQTTVLREQNTMMQQDKRPPGLTTPNGPGKQ